MSAWISVEERLPEKFTDVVCSVNGRFYIGWRGDKDDWYSIDIVPKFAPDYWQPLPEPPEET